MAQSSKLGEVYVSAQSDLVIANWVKSAVNELSCLTRATQADSARERRWAGGAAEACVTGEVRLGTEIGCVVMHMVWGRHAKVSFSVSGFVELHSADGSVSPMHVEGAAR